MALRSDVSEASLRALAGAYELDADVILDEMDSDAVNEVLVANRALGDRMAITGTPTFVFGNQLVRGYVDLDQMRQIVATQREDS